MRPCHCMSQFPQHVPARPIAPASRKRSPAPSATITRPHRSSPLACRIRKSTIRLRRGNDLRHPSSSQQQDLELPRTDSTAPAAPARAVFATGNSLPVGSRLSSTPSEANHRIVAGRVERRQDVTNDILQPVKILRDHFVMRGHCTARPRPPESSPPRVFAPSKTTMRKPAGACSAAKIAAANPARAYRRRSRDPPYRCPSAEL